MTTCAALASVRRIGNQSLGPPDPLGPPDVAITIEVQLAVPFVDSLCRLSFGFTSPRRAALVRFVPFPHVPSTSRFPPDQTAGLYPQSHRRP